jgi:GT2 family glycosyltransferase
MVIVISATRGSSAEFLERPLGRSLARMSFDATLQFAVVENNQAGLPAAFNRFLVEELRPHALVFVHDDVWIDDLFFSDRIRAALETFDVAGLAGNRRLLPGASAWHVKNNAMEWDRGFLSGIVCHGAQPFGVAEIYGPTPAPVQLLDGVLLASRASALLDAGVRFDQRFDFHHYDMDFSRQANAAGLKVGTWPIAVTHASGGAFGTPAWKRSLALYREKWPVAAETGDVPV